MSAETKKIDKGLYNKLLWILKRYPFILSVLYLAGSLMTCFEIETVVMVILCKTSMFSLVVLLLSSHALDYCIRHRMPLYYVFVCNITDIVHKYMDNHHMVYFWVYIGYFVVLYIVLLILWLNAKGNKSCAPADD